MYKLGQGFPRDVLRLELGDTMGEMNRNTYLIKLIFIALIIIASPCLATTYHVPLDRPTIQSGISASENGDTVLVAPGYYTGGGNTNVELEGKEITVMSESGSGSTIIDCENNARAFFIREFEGPSTLIQGFTIRNGFSDEHGEAAGAGIRIQYAAATFRDIHIKDCYTPSWGGGLHAFDAIQVVVENCVIENCSADGNGGGLSCWGSNLTLSQSLITGCSAGELGAGIYLENAFFNLNESIVAFNDGGSQGIYQFDENGGNNLSCNIVFGHLPGDYGGFIPDHTGTNGNLSLDPIFCDAEAGDYTLHTRSPGLPANNDCGLLIGPFGGGCNDPIYIISGRLAQEDETPISGIVIFGGPGPIYSNYLGDYSVVVPEGWSGTLIPDGTNYDFVPEQRVYSSVNSDFLDQDYLGTADRVHHVPAEFATIQSAVDAAMQNDTVLVAPGTYTGAGNFDINFGGKNLSLIGSGGSANTILDGEGNDLFSYLMIFENQEDSTSLVEGFTLTRTRHIMDGGAIVCRVGSSPKLRDLRFFQNENRDWPYGYSSGGGLYCNGSGTSPMVEDCVFEENAYNYGGAVDVVQDAMVVFRNVEFIQNGALEGGAVRIRGAWAEFYDCLFQGNVAERHWVDDNYLREGQGAAVYAYGDQGQAYFKDCLFTGNVAQNDYPVDPWDPYGESGSGAILYARDSIEIVFEGCTLVGNDSEVYDLPLGTIATHDESSLTMTNCLLAFNTEGGGVYCDESAGALTVFSCSDVYGNGAGNFLGFCPDPSWDNGNISSDPLFCDLAGGTFGLNAMSPCLPENNECGVLMGLFGEDCDNPFFTISGRVVSDGGQGVFGISILADGHEAHSDGNGDYTLILPPGWSGTVVPAKIGFDFTPESRSYVDLQSNIEDQGYVAFRDWIHSVPSEFETIQEAINASLVGDTVLVETGVHVGEGNRNLIITGKAITLLGQGGPDATIIDCENEDRGVYVYGEGTDGTVIKDLSFVNGLSTDPATAAGGAVRVELSSSTLENLIIKDCTTHTWGGGLHAHNAELDLLNIEISGCYSWIHGGGLSLRSSTTTASGLLVVNNESGYNGYGAGLYHEGGQSDIDASIFAFNQNETSTEGLVGAEEAILNLSCSDVFGHSDGNYGGEFGDLTGVGGNISEAPRFCDPDWGDYELAADSPCLPDNNSCALLMGPYGQGCEIPTYTPEDLPVQAYLAQNVPNPFNPNTMIHFGLASDGPVSLVIYELSGRRVARLLDREPMVAGAHHIRWSGRDDSGRRLSSGIYLYKLRTEGGDYARKMTLIK